MLDRSHGLDELLVGRARGRAAGEHDVAAGRAAARPSAPRRPAPDRRRSRSRPSCRAELPRRRQRRAVGGVAQQRLAHPLAEDPSLAAGGAEYLPLRARRRPGMRCLAHRPPLARVQRQRRTRSAAAPSRRPSPGDLLVERLEPDRPASDRRGARCRAGCRRHGLQTRFGSQPQPRRQPARQQQRAGREARLVADRELARSGSSRDACGQVEAGGQPLAPRRGAQPRQVDHVRRRASSSAARASASGGSTTRRSRAASRRSAAAAPATASSWPCGDHSTVGSSETSTGIDDRLELRQVLGPDVDLDALAHHADDAVLGLLVAHRPRPRRASCGPPRPRTGRCARRGSGRPARAGWRSRPSTRGRRSRRGSAPGRAPAPRSPRGARAAARAAPPRSRRVSCPAQPRRPRSRSPPAHHSRRHRWHRRAARPPPPARPSRPGTAGSARSCPRARRSGSGR